MDNKITLRHCIEKFAFIDSYKVVDVELEQEILNESMATKELQAMIETLKAHCYDVRINEFWYDNALDDAIEFRCDEYRKEFREAVEKIYPQFIERFNAGDAKVIAFVCDVNLKGLRCAVAEVMAEYCLFKKSRDFTYSPDDFDLDSFIDNFSNPIVFDAYRNITA